MRIFITKDTIPLHIHIICFSFIFVTIITVRDISQFIYISILSEMLLSGIYGYQSDCYANFTETTSNLNAVSSPELNVIVTVTGPLEPIKSKLYIAYASVLHY